jgi:uncharacterized membrane protein YcaP (DUF421 family)
MHYHRFPHDLTPDFRAQLRARARIRAIAYFGLLAWLLIASIAIGALVTTSRSHLLAIIILTAWAAWGARHILTRH